MVVNATFLVVSTPITAHTLNATPVVSGLVRAGHRVLWYSGAQFAGHVSRAGATHVAFRRANDFSRGGLERFVSRGSMDALTVVRGLYRDALVRQAGAQAMDIEEVMANEPVDAVISDTLMLGAGIASSHTGVPWATIGDGPLLWHDPDTPPFGAGLPPLAGAAGRHRNVTVKRATERWIFAEARSEFNALRGERGLPAVESLQSAGMSAQLHLQGCTPAFEYPRSNLPDSVHFIGALGPGPGVAPPVPTACLREHRSRPLAFVTQGTLRQNLQELAVPAVRALADDGYDVLVAAGTRSGPPMRALESRSSRVRVVESVDYLAALQETDIFVTNGGYTGVTLALAAGVPVLQAGATEEKADIGARVEWAGVGASLRQTRPAASRIRRTARRIMESRARQEASRRVADEMAGYDAATLGARLVGQLVGVQQR